MNVVKIFLSTKFTSTPAHCKIYCCEQLIFDATVNKDSVITHSIKTTKPLKIKIIKTGKTIDIVKQKEDQIVKVEKISVNNIDMKINEFGIFEVKDNFYIDNYTLQTTELTLNGEWSISLLDQPLIGKFDIKNVELKDQIGDCDIACFGCSQTYGSFLTYEQTWPYYLGKILNLNVKNFGIGGSSTNEIIAFTEYFTKNNRANIILLLLPHSFRRQISENGKIKNISSTHTANKNLIIQGEEHSIINLSLSLGEWLRNIHKKIFISTYHFSEYSLMNKTPIANYLLPFLDPQYYPKASDNLHFSPEYNKDYAELLANFIKEKGLI